MAGGRVSFLEFDCNYECGRKIVVDVSDRPRNSTVHTPFDVLYRWLGEKVMTALMRHHVHECTEFNKGPDGRPHLTLVATR